MYKRNLAKILKGKRRVIISDAHKVNNWRVAIVVQWNM